MEKRRPVRVETRRVLGGLGWFSCPHQRCEAASDVPSVTDGPVASAERASENLFRFLACFFFYANTF